MRELAQEVLAVSKDENDSNEVAIICDLGVDNPLEVYGVSFGTEHEVDVRADTLSNHILVSQKSVAVVILHNRPSTQTFSIQDIRFFIEFSALEVMVLVSNQGMVHYLRREESYELKKAVALFNECVEDLKKDSSLTEVYLAALSFLARSSEVGIYYRSEVEGMESYVLNDVEYDFKPLEIFVPDPDYKVDEKELKKSIEKNKAIITRARESRKRYLQNMM